MSEVSTGMFMHAADVFTAVELDAIERYGDSLAQKEASIGERAPDDKYKDIRITKVAAIDLNDETRWIYERLFRAAVISNRAWRFEFNGLNEVQYLVYRDIDGGHYNWHIDQGPKVMRKLSLTLQLTDPSRYQGCELQFGKGHQIVTAPKARGTVVVFPSDALHRVSPIISGIRKSIVAWAS